MGLVYGHSARASEMRCEPLASAADTPSLSGYVEGLSEHRSSDWAWRHYKEVLVDLLRIRHAKRMMEIGGGRFPLFDREEIAPLEIEYIINDLSPLGIGART
jgi:hypothetical protein